MQRCLDLALLGVGSVAPNPMVGAVLVYENRIIGEGFHQVFGQAHAEVNCLNSVKQEDQPYINKSTLYVSLEPCSHFGKTPPCSMLIIKYGIPKVIIGCQDPFPKVAGSGIEALKQAGVEVVVGVLEQAAHTLNKRFICYHQNKRPFIILKWAQTANGKIAGVGEDRLLITNEFTNRLVHRWRNEEAAILVGFNTALKDNPRLDNRYWKGNAPIRMVIDRNLSLPSHLHLLDESIRTIVWNQVKNHTAHNLDHVLIDAEKDTIEQILTASYQMGIQSVIVEGGAALLQTFIDKGLWDEARVISNELLSIDAGLDAPVLKQAEHFDSAQIQTDSIHYFHPSLQV